MQVSSQQQVGGGAARSANGAPSRRRTGAAVIAAVVACTLGAIAVLVASRQGTPGIGATDSTTSRATRPTISGSVATDSRVAWVDGLASGLILPSDVTSRLAGKDPEAADSVIAAWSRLDEGSADGSRLDRTIRWVDGLAAGLIRPSDVMLRLAPHDPEMGRAVMAAWAALQGDRSGDR